MTEPAADTAEMAQLRSQLASLAAELKTVRDSELRYRSLFEHAPTGLGMANASGDLLAFNQAMLEPGGYTREEIERIGNVAALYFDAADRAKALGLARSQGYLRQFETRFKRKDGTPYDALISLNPTTIDGQHGWLAVVQDITERKQMEEELRQAQHDLEARVQARTEHLEEANRQLQAEIDQRQQVEQDLREERQMLRRILQTQEHDRQLVAYEIHDGLVQYIVGALMQMELLHDHLPPDASAQQRYAQAMRYLRNSVDDARRLISGLRPPILDESGIGPALDYLVNEHRDQNPGTIDLNCTLYNQRFHPVIESSVFRICQEALTNVRKHSQAQQVRVEVQQQEERLQIEVEDNGCGFEIGKVQEKSYGLRGVRQRARLLGGKVQIHTLPGIGTRLLVELPCKPPDGM